jgi:enamine deaminase RidA (YjgF/YER057c/UK114 family)
LTDDLLGNRDAMLQDVWASAYRRGKPMTSIGQPLACVLLAAAALSPAVAQDLEIKRYNPSEWTKGRFSEVVTVNGPGRTIYLAGIRAEEETAPAGSLASVRHLGNVYEECKYSYDRIKRLLGAHGATLADVVKQVTYVTDVRFLLHSEGAASRPTGMDQYRQTPSWL